MTLKAGGLEYDVRITDGLGDCGSTKFDNQIVLINGNMTSDRIQSTVWHEYIEIVNEIADLNLNHQTIQTLEAFIFQIAKDNGMYFKDLI